MNAQDVLSFWFEEIEPSRMWVKDEAFDQLGRDRFMDVHRSAAACELSAWRDTARGRLAEVIVLDQFSRNMFRDQALAFGQDNLGLALAQEAVRAGADTDLAVGERTFMYMPYMHSESAVVHEKAVTLFSLPGLEQNLEFELKHKVIIDRFGRYPHRNKLLGRESTAEELEYLKEPGSGF